MKGRVGKFGNFWYGEVYDPFFTGAGWVTVTSNCFTKFGATLELKYWISQNSYTYIEV